MKIDTTASWGYPVLRSDNDDYVNCEFQSELLLRTNPNKMSTIEIDFSIELSVSELKELIESKQAECVLYVHCRNTWYEEVFPLKSLTGVIELNKELIEGDTNFWTLIIANREIRGFSSKKFNDEYQGFTFDILPQQILGIASPEAQFISRDFFKSVTSLFDYDINDNVSEGNWKIGLNDNRITIIANNTQLGYFRSAENTDLGKSVLLNGIFLPATQYCVSELLNSPESYEDYRWASIFKAKMEEISEKSDSLVIAQHLLQNPTSWLNKNMKWRDDEA